MKIILYFIYNILHSSDSGSINNNNNNKIMYVVYNVVVVSSSRRIVYSNRRTALGTESYASDDVITTLPAYSFASSVIYSKRARLGQDAKVDKFRGKIVYKILLLSSFVHCS